MIPLGLRRKKTAHPRNSALGSGLKLLAASTLPRRSYSASQGDDRLSPNEENSDNEKLSEKGDWRDSDIEQEPNYYNSSDEEELDRQSSTSLDLPSDESVHTATSLQYSNTTKKADELEPLSQPASRSIKSTKSKQLTTIPNTISEDQSCDSEISLRRLKAFIISNVHKEAPTEQSAQPPPTKDSDTTPNGTGATDQHMGFAAGSILPKNTLQQFQPQLELLAEVNKKRLMMAKQESDSMKYPNKALRGGKRKLPAHPPRGDENSLNASTSTQSPHDTSKNRFNNQDDALIIALSVISKTLNLQDESALTIENLRSFALAVQDGKDHEKTYNPRMEMIYCVSMGDGKKAAGHKMYLDMPKWVEGALSSRDALVGNLLIQNIPAYLSKNPDVCFLVYRHYDTSSTHGDDSEQEDQITPTSPRHTAETIEIFAEELLTAVEKFLEHYGFLDATEPNKLSAPYPFIYHAMRDNLDDFLETLDDKAQRQFQALLGYVDKEYADEYRIVDEMTSRGKITHAFIHYLFKPGDIVVKLSDQDSQGYLCKEWLGNEQSSTETKVKKSSKRSTIKTYPLSCWNWTFDGMFSRQNVDLQLALDIKNQSERNIDDLEIRPLKYVNDRTVSRLERRGEWIWKCRVRHVVSYDDTHTGLQNSTQERYMIDMMMYRELHQSNGDNDQRRFNSIDELGPEILKEDNPPDKLKYLMPMMIKGYNLKRKKWVDLRADSIREVVWNTRAFESLEIGRTAKKTIQALISNQIESEKSTDLISGKGNGLILLLHGGPGTGKTLTAESMAEIAGKPLYPVTCGDIGTEPEAVETYLESVLHIGKTWGCVVLLDEADVFLEQRDLNDLRRNALVSVFLRVLEYYDGILVLTSNRVGTFDEAFKSRIQLAVHYDNLTTNQRRKIWGNFIQRLEELGEEGIDFVDLRHHIPQLAENNINGREIRNVITIARQYARWERGQPNQSNDKLDYEMMKGVLETTKKFDQYIRGVKKGLTADAMAAEDGIR
ncbi:hypothetical protein ABKA04_005678 [Annulohypoxylon sp. FPYF3050]